MQNIQTEDFENILLKKPLYNKLTKAIIPALAALVIIGSVYLLITAPQAALQGLDNPGIIRISVSGLIFIISIIPFFKKDYYVITSYKVMQFNQWEINFKDIRAVDLHKNFLKRYIEITPKINPEIKFVINQWDIDQNVGNVTSELVKRIKHINVK